MHALDALLCTLCITLVTHWRAGGTLGLGWLSGLVGGGCQAELMDGQKQLRVCSCGVRLARDNKSSLCSICQRNRRNNFVSAPNVPVEFWQAATIRKAIDGRHMGQIIYAYRTHSFHGKVIPQAVIAQWANISQAQLSRLESGPPLHDLQRLMQWVHILRIPSRLLWFRADGPRR